MEYQMFKSSLQLEGNNYVEKANIPLRQSYGTFSCPFEGYCLHVVK